MKMKNYILFLAWMVTMNVMPVQAQSDQTKVVNNALQTARQKAEDALQAAEKAQELADRLEAVADSLEEGIEAYSDTMEDVFEANNRVQAKKQVLKNDFDWNPDHYDGFIAWLFALTATTWGMFVAILVVFMVLLLLLSPLIILALILRLIIKRHNDRISLAEKAMESGQPIPDGLQGIDRQSDDYLKKRGIRNAAIGLGLMLMFWIWNAHSLVGLGALVFCYGMGQLGMAYASRK